MGYPDVYWAHAFWDLGPWPDAPLPWAPRTALGYAIVRTTWKSTRSET